MSSKYEGKTSNEGKSSNEGKEGEEPATINVRAIRVDEDGDKGPRGLEDLLRLEIDFDSDTQLRNAKWKVRYMVDVVAKRYVVELGVQTEVAIHQGTNTFSFVLDAIDMSGVKRKHLINNAGLLTASLTTEDEQDVIDINLVVQVAKVESGGLVRHILNPLR